MHIDSIIFKFFPKTFYERRFRIGLILRRSRLYIAKVGKILLNDSLFNLYDT